MPDMVDRGVPEPPYRQVAAVLRARIDSGEYPPRSRVPSVEQIVGEFGVARVTARKALRVLVDDGLAEFITGWGTFVVDRAAR